MIFHFSQADQIISRVVDLSVNIARNKHKFKHKRMKLEPNPNLFTY